MQMQRYVEERKRTKKIINHTKMKIIAGEPGTGKTQRLVNDAIDKLLQNKTVRIVTPTHSAKENILSRINEMKDIETDVKRLVTLYQLSSKVSVLYGYKGEDVILIDEISMISIPMLFNLLYQTIDIEGAEIIGYGDAKQLPVIKGNSIIENLLRYNLTVDTWEWVKQAYDNVDFEQLVAPKSWKLSDPIDFVVLRTNYRLNSLGYNGYNSKYIQDVIDNTLYDKYNKYEDIILSANSDNVLIITPDHTSRGAQVNDIINKHYGSEAYKHMPFVKEISGSKVYINPYYEYNVGKLNFLDMIDKKKLDKSKIKYEYTGYVVVNVAQGVTVDDVLYFIGNGDIPNNLKSFYTRNNLYTAITRSRNMTQTVGRVDVLNEMLNNLPMSPQMRLQHVVSNQAVKNLFDNLSSIQQELSIDEIYDMYLNIFSNTDVKGPLGDELESYNIINVALNKNELMNEFGKYNDDISIIKYKEIIYDKHISDVNSENKKGKGKIQQWVESLSNDKLNDVKDDIDKLSVRKFKAKWNMNKQLVVKYIKEKV